MVKTDVQEEDCDDKVVSVSFQVEGLYERFPRFIIVQRSSVSEVRSVTLVSIPKSEPSVQVVEQISDDDPLHQSTFRSIYVPWQNVQVDLSNDSSLDTGVVRHGDVLETENISTRIYTKCEPVLPDLVFR